MAKFKLQAGAEIETLDKADLEKVLKNWSVELTRGAKLRRRSILGTVDAGGNLTMGDNDDGPAEGMVWAVTRLSVFLPTGATLGANGLQVYANDVTPSALLISRLTTDVFPGDHAANLLSGDSLRINGTGITVGAQVVVTVGIKEVPELMAWSL